MDKIGYHTHKVKQASTILYHWGTLKLIIFNKMNNLFAVLSLNLEHVNASLLNY